MTDGLSEAYEEKQWDVFCENNDLRLENDQLKSENVKLRELVRLAYDCATSGVSCRDCDLVFGEGSCKLKSELESIGIEVDDGTE